MEVRPFEAEHWRGLWPIWREVVDAGETYAFDPGWSEDEARSIWVERPPGRTVVAVEDGAVLGSAKMGPNRPGRGSHVGTASFMVGSRARGHGVGRALAEEVVGWHRAQGYRAIQFNAVVETNEPALALWRSLGFEIVGTVPEAFDHPRFGYVGLHVMYLRL